MNKKVKKILSIASASTLVLSISCSTVPENLISPVTSATVVSAYAADTDSMTSDSEHYSDEQQKLLTTALSLKGKIRYTWGGKASSTGWNARWSRGTGLDCSGFVQWSFWTALGIRNGLGSTAEISGSFPSISKSQLRPGDLGLMFDGGSGYKDKNGKMHDSKEAAQAANKSIATQTVNSWLNGSGGSVHATAACENAKTAQAKYQKAKKEAEKTTANPESLKKKAENALSKANELESQASAAEESAAAYTAQIRTLKGSSVKAYSASSASRKTADDTETARAAKEKNHVFQAYSSVSAEAEADGSETSASEEASRSSAAEETTSSGSEEKTANGNSEGNSEKSSSSGSTSNTGKPAGGSSSGSEQPNTGKSERIQEYAAKASELTEKAKKLRKEADTLKAEAEKDKKAAEKAENATDKEKKAAKEKLDELKEEAASAKEKAINAESSSYKTSQNANHVGIYVGKDAAGNDLWVHCNSTNNTVSVNNFGGFHYFVRVIKNNHYTAKSEKTTYTDIVKQSKELANVLQEASNFDNALLKRELFLGPVVNKAEDRLMQHAREIRSHLVYRTVSEDSAAK